MFAFSHFPFVLSYRQRQLVISYLLQAVASSFVEITASSCDILSLRQNLDQQNETKHFKQAAMFDRVSKSTMGWEDQGNGAKGGGRDYHQGPWTGRGPGPSKYAPSPWIPYF